MEKLARQELILSMLEKEPNDVFLNYALAMEYLAVADEPQAEAQLQKVLAIDAHYLPCFYQLGQLKEKQSQTDEAIGYYKQGIEMAQAQHNTKALGELKEALWMLESE